LKLRKKLRKIEKNFSFPFLLFFLFSVLFTLPVFADGEKEQVDVYENEQLVKSVVFVIGLNEYFVDGKTPGIKMDAFPYASKGRTFVPVRYLGNALGVEDKNISWDAKAKKAVLRHKNTVELTIGKKEIAVNGSKRAIDVSPEVRTGRTYLPARFVAEALGYEVAWDAKTNTIICWPKGEPKPDIASIIEYVKKQETETYQLNGYTIPKDTGDITDVYEYEPAKIELHLTLRVDRPLEPQWATAEKILSSKLSKSTVDRIMGLIKQKTEVDDGIPNGVEWFKADGKEFRVEAYDGEYIISICIYYA